MTLLSSSEAPVAHVPHRRACNRAWAIRWRNPDLAKSVVSKAKSRGPAMPEAMIVEASLTLWTGRLSQAEDLTREAFLHLASEDHLWFCRAANIHATVLYSFGQRDAASELVHEAMDRAQSELTADIYAELHLSHAVLHLLSLDYDTALQIAADGHTFARAKNFKTIAILLESNIARFLIRKGDFAAAEEWALKAQYGLSQQSIPVFEPYLREVLGEVYLSTGRCHDAIDILEDGLKLADALGDLRAACQILAVLGRAWDAIGVPRRALKVLAKGQTIADEIAYPLWQRRFRLANANAYEKMGDLGAALEAFKDYVDIDRRLFDIETEKRLGEMRTRYKLEEARKVAQAERERSEELDRAREKAEWLAWTDTLTGLRNRHALLSDLPEKLAEAGLGELVLMLLDLDRFKQVNDTYGHDAGDAVLVAVSNRMRDALDAKGVPYRLGGDEFAIILEPGVTLAQAEAIATGLIPAIMEPVQFEGRGLYVGASIGIALSPENANAPAELLRVADVALYEAKTSGRGQYKFYEPNVDHRARRQRVLENDLRTAIEKDQLRLVFQPLVDAQTHEVVGAEALLRWQHPTLGLLAPSEFIEIMERSDMVFSIGEWVLKTGWDTLGELERLFPERHFSISLNVSSRQFFDNAFIETLQDLKFEGPYLVERLELEITESTMVHNISHAVSVMCDIGALGYRLSIDDFGTGYSSIAQLAKLPVHTLKVDKTFLDELGISESSTTVVKSIIDLGINLGLTVTAEGVETKAQADYLRRNRCHRLQGYLFGRPMEKISLLAYLAAQEKSSHCA